MLSIVFKFWNCMLTQLKWGVIVSNASVVSCSTYLIFSFVVTSKFGKKSGLSCKSLPITGMHCEWKIVITLQKISRSISIVYIFSSSSLANDFLFYCAMFFIALKYSWIVSYHTNTYNCSFLKLNAEVHSHWKSEKLNAN